MGRVAAISLDAAEWWYVERLIDEGRLPTLARLRDASATHVLDTPEVFRTEISWARFLTGQDPVATRDWAASMTFDPATYGLGSTPASPRPPFYAFGDGTKVISLDLIHCSLAEEGVDGEQVIAWGSHAPQFPRCSKPHGLLTEIDERFGTSALFANDSGVGWYQPGYVDAFVDAAKDGMAKRTDIAGWLLERTPDWELFLMCISEIHSAGHLMWHGVDETSPLHTAPGARNAGRSFDEVLVAADAELGRILQMLPQDVSVVVFAFHGTKPADDLLCTVLAPELLHRRYVDRRSPLRSPDADTWRAQGCPPVVLDEHVGWGDYMIDRFADSPKTHLRRALRTVLPDRAFTAIRRLMGRQTVTPELAELAAPVPAETMVIDEAALAPFRTATDYQPAAWYSRHWPSMPAFTLPTFADGHVRINLIGRERDGLVALEDYASVCEEIEALLFECRDARTGAPVVNKVIRLRADDPLAPDGPDCDLLVLWSGAPDAIEHPDLGVIGPFPHMRTATHTTNGFAFVSGPGITPGPRGVSSTENLTATVLALMGRSDSNVIGTSLVEMARGASP